MGEPTSTLLTSGAPIQMSAAEWSTGSDTIDRTPSTIPDCSVMSTALNATATTAGK
jgi:hypothetical protein